MAVIKISSPLADVAASVALHHQVDSSVAPRTKMISREIGGVQQALALLAGVLVCLVACSLR